MVKEVWDKGLNEKLNELQIPDKKARRQTCRDQASIKEQFCEQWRRLELILKQKSWELCLRKGDKNFYFFFASTLMRLRQKKIFVVQNEARYITDRIVISSYFFKELRALYAFST